MKSIGILLFSRSYHQGSSCSCEPKSKLNKACICRDSEGVPSIQKGQASVILMILYVAILLSSAKQGQRIGSIIMQRRCITYPVGLATH